MKEHHGVEVNTSSVRRIAEQHASRAGDIEGLPTRKQESKQMIAEMDGEMVPLVEYTDSKDRRKTKKNHWAELRIGTAQNFGEASWKYACSFKNADHLGNRLKEVMLRLGLTEQTKVHGVGDGALWIVEQGEKIAGQNYQHLIDLYHLCDYFAGAVIAWEEKTRQEVERLKHLAEEGEIGKILKELKERQKIHPNHEGIKKCVQYIENRSGEFKYKEAKQMGLPLGSGKVESSHRSLMQKRLKKPGTWWLREKAADMANLRTLRANGGWKLLWQQDLIITSVLMAA